MAERQASFWKGAQLAYYDSVQTITKRDTAFAYKIFFICRLLLIFFSAFSYIALQARELFFIKLKFYLQPSTNLSTIQYNKKKKIKLTTILYFPLIRLGFKYSATKISSHKVLHFLSEM